MTVQGLDPGRAVEIISPPEDYGSGYRIGGRLVLTAAHLVRSRSRCQVRKRSSTSEIEWQKDAQVVWRAQNADAALVELPNDIEGIEPAVLGGLPARSIAKRIPFEMYGWPKWSQTIYQEEKPKAAGRHIPGEIFLADRSPEGFLVLEPERIPGIPLPSERGSQWEGMSGAAVVCNGIVVAVQHSHQRPDRPQSLEAEPLTRFIDDGEFRRILSEHDIPLVFPKVLISELISIDWLLSYSQHLDEEFEKLLRPDKQLGPGEATKYYLDVLVRERLESAVSPEAVPLSMLLEKAQKPVVVLGGGGTGKTGMLRKLACDLAQRALVQGDSPLPIFLGLKFFDPRGGKFEGLLESAQDLLPSDKLKTMWLQETRPCIFFLDAFNEVSNDFQGDCCLALQQFTHRKNHKFVITSRPGPQVDELRKQLGECVVAEVVKLEPDQIKEFLAAYGAEDLYDRMSEKLKALAENPFLLWAIAQSCTILEVPDLPDNIGQLYQNLIDHYIFGDREQAKPEASRPTRYNYELVKKPILANLGMEMCCRGDTQQPEDDQFLDDIVNHLEEIAKGRKKRKPFKPYIFMPQEFDATTLLDEVVENGILHRSRGELEFMHDSVRDYFAAVEMAGFMDKSPKDLSDFIPRLVWRFIDPSYFELTLEEPPFPAVIMLSGLLADSSDLVRNLAGQHPLLAAHCLGGVGSIKPGVRTELVEQWLDLLDRGHPRYRWVGCQCLRAARVDSRDIAERLVKLITSDREKRVCQVAMRTLIGLNYPDLNESVVEEALNATPANDVEDILGETFFDLRSGVAVRDLFAVWRNPEQPKLRRNRAARLLASMERRLVRKVLDDLQHQAINTGDDGLATSVTEAMEALESRRWIRIGSSLGKFLSEAQEVADKLNQETKLLSLCRQSMTNYSVTQLTEAFKDLDAKRRAAAASLLGERRALSVAELLDALAHEKDYNVRRALFEALEALDQPEELLQQWQTRMLDPQKNFLFKVEPGMEKDLQAVGLSERWRQEFAGRHLAVSPPAEVRTTEDGWLIYEYIVPYYLIKPGPDGLEVYDALKQRLIPVAKAIGTPATPILQEISNQADYQTTFAVARALGEIGSEESLSLLGKLLREFKNLYDVMTLIHPLVKSQPRMAISVLIPLLFTLGLPSKTTLSVANDRQVDSFRKIVREIIQQLKSLQWYEMVEWAKDFLGSEKAISRFKATVCLSLLYETDPEVEGLLKQALADPEPRIRSEAVAGLAHRKTESNEQSLLDVCLEDPDHRVRREAGLGLRRFPGDRAWEHLVRTLEDQDLEKRARAAEALGLLQEDAAIPPLLKAFETGSDRLRAAACWALTYLGYEKEDVLIEAMISVARKNPDIYIREMAFDAIKKLRATNKFLYPIVEALKNNQFEKVIDLTSQYLPFLPQNNLLYFARGCARLGLQKPDQALEDLDQAIKLEPERSSYVYLMRAQALGQLDRWWEALAAARQAVSYERGDSKFYGFLGHCAYRTANYQESIEASRQALELNPKDINAAFNLGEALLADRQWEEAEKAYRRGIEILKEHEDEPARQALDAAVQDLEDLTKTRPECAGPASLAKNLLEQARVERFGSKS